MADAGIPVVADDLVDFLAAGADAGQVRGRLERGLFKDALDRAVGPLARGAAGAVGHRHEGWIERLEPVDRGPQGLFHRLGLRGEELEREADAALAALAGPGDRADDPRMKLGDGGAHAALLACSGTRSAVQILTVRPGSAAGGRLTVLRSPRPAASTQRSISA